MAKQYIPGVSGLLTEPNPVDAPSNTLSEAENVVVEQNSKVKSRHGLNVKEDSSTASFYDSDNAISSDSLNGGFGTPTDVYTRDPDDINDPSDPEYDPDNLNYLSYYILNPDEIDDMQIPSKSVNYAGFNYIKKNYTGTFFTQPPLTANNLGVFSPNLFYDVSIAGNLTHYASQILYNEPTLLSLTQDNLLIDDLSVPFSLIPTIEFNYSANIGLLIGLYSTSSSTLTDYIKLDYNSITNTYTNLSSFGADIEFVDISGIKQKSNQPTITGSSFATQSSGRVYTINLRFKLNNLSKKIVFHYYPRTVNAYDSRICTQDTNYNSYTSLGETTTFINTYQSPSYGSHTALMKVGDLITLPFGSNPPKLVSGGTLPTTNGRYEVISISGNNITISHPGYTTTPTGWSGTGSISLFSSYGVQNVYLNQNPNRNYSIYSVPYINRAHSTEFGWVLGNTNYVIQPIKSSPYNAFQGFGLPSSFGNDTAITLNPEVYTDILPFTTGTTYYVVNWNSVTKQFGLSSTIGGSVIVFGSGFRSFSNPDVLYANVPSCITTKFYFKGDNFNQSFKPFCQKIKFIGKNVTNLPSGLNATTEYTVLDTSTKNDTLYSGAKKSIDYMIIDAVTNSLETPPVNPIEFNRIYTIPSSNWTLGNPTQFVINSVINSSQLTLDQPISSDYIKIRFTNNNLPVGLSEHETYTATTLGYKDTLDASSTNAFFERTRSFTFEINANTSGSLPTQSIDFEIVSIVDQVFGTVQTNAPMPVPHYIYTSQYTNILPFLKLLKYKDTNENPNIILFAKQTINSYAANETGIFKTTSDKVQNRYYIINEDGNLGKYETLPYEKVTDAFVTKDSLYIHTETGLAETDINAVTNNTKNRFFDFKWPTFPKLSYKINQNDLFANWFTAGSKFYVRMTFYREMGYDDSFNEIIYESSPSSPILVTTGVNGVPTFYIDFQSNGDDLSLFDELNKFSKLNNGRKFGLKLYRTKTTPLNEDPQTEYFLMAPEISFENFMSAKIYNYNSDLYINSSVSQGPYSIAINSYGDIKQQTSTAGALNNPSFYPTHYRLLSNYNVELEVNDIVYIQNVQNLTLPGVTVTQTKYKTSDTYFAKNNYKGIRLKVLEKLPYTYDYTDINPTTGLIGTFIKTSYFYKFAVIDDLQNFVKDLVVGINDGPTPSPILNFNDPLLLTKTVISEIGVDDNGLIEQPRLYTDINIDGAENSNEFAPISKNSYPYQDFRVYSNIKKSLTGTFYVNKQLRFFSTNLYVDEVASFSSATLPYQFLSIQNFIIKTSPSISNITNGTTSNGQRYFIDSPVFPDRDYEINTLTNNMELTNTTWSAQTIEPSSLYVKRTMDSVIPTCTLSRVSGLVQVSAATDTVLSKISFRPGTSGLPSEITAGQVYYVRNESGGIFNLSLTPTGPLIATSNTSTFTGTYFLTDSTALDYYFKSTIYEQGKLTLRLTSIDDEINQVSIKTAPFYNRGGYYNKLTEAGVSDNRAYEYDFSISEMNGPLQSGFINTRTAILGEDSRVYNVPGKLNGQAKFQGKVDKIFNSTVLSSGVTATFYQNGTISVSTELPTGTDLNDAVITFSNADFALLPAEIRAVLVPNVPYYIVEWSSTEQRFKVADSPGGTVLKTSHTTSGSVGVVLNYGNLIYTNAGRNGGLLIVRNTTTNTNLFDVDAFKEPGFVFIQWSNPFTYYNVNVDPYGNTTEDRPCTTLISYSSIRSNNAGSSNYVFKNAQVSAGFSNFTSVTNNRTAYLFALTGASAEELPLYPYSEPFKISDIIIKYVSGTSRKIQTLDYDRTTGPHFTTVIHNKRTQTPITTIAQDKNNRFLGQIAGYAKSIVDLSEEYTNFIINSFNQELQNNNIKAFLYKGPGAGEIQVVYPNGKKIEIKNDYGSHEFIPSISTTDFTVIGEEINLNNEDKNLIQWSRRNIPEIVPNTLYARIGKNDKSVVGVAINSDDMYIFKEDGIWRCTAGADTNGFDLPTIATFNFSNTVICQSAESIQTINDEIIFLSQYGFMSIVNGSIQSIDDPINADVLALLSITPKDRIQSFANQTRSVYYCTLIAEVDSSLEVKSGTYVFNLKSRQWSFMDEEILSGLEDYEGKNVTAFRQRPVIGKLLDRVDTEDGIKPIFDFTQSTSNNKLIRSTESDPVDLFYTTREQYTNNIRNNSKDQYDYMSEIRTEGNSEFYIVKSGDNEFYIKTEQIPTNSIFRNKFRTSVEHALMSEYSDYPAIGDDVSVIDSFVTLFANRSLYLQKNNSSTDMIQIRLKKTGIVNLNTLVYFEFVNEIPSWFSSMAPGFFDTGTNSTYRILAGIPVKITFNPESGNSPDTNKLFQEYMIHTETANKGALMSFKTDSRTNFTPDRRFVYDANTTNRNVFRTYIPTQVSRGRYLIRQIKHDLPLENLIITGQTVVIRDSGSTRVQKDKDNQ